MHFLPWWLLVAYLAASAFAAYLLLGRTQVGDSRWALFALTAVVASLLLAGAMAAAIALSTLLSAFPGDRTAGPPEPAAKTERTEVEAPPEGTDLRTTLEWTSPETGSPSASPNAAADASPPPLLPLRWYLSRGGSQTALISIHPSALKGCSAICGLGLLRDMGCDMAQGFHFARPLPPEEVPGFLAEQRLPGQAFT